MEHPTLRSPFPLSNSSLLPNRIGKAATSEALADRRTGEPSEALIRLYERWGRGGAGLLITGNVALDLDARTEPGNVVVHDRRFVDSLRLWASAAQAHGSQLFMQINHAGRQVSRRISNHPIAPSPIAVEGKGGIFAEPRALTENEILDLVQRFASAAEVAQEAGFAGVQIHAAHGYLISQFLSPLTNKRTDQWGGSAENRMRFLLQVIAAVRSRVGRSYPIAVKLNSADFQRGGFTEEESMKVVQALEHAGIDLLEISGGSYEKSAMMGEDSEQRESTRKREAYFLDYAERVRNVTKLPLMLTGGLRSAKAMNAVLASGAVDLIGMARPLIVQPDLPNALLQKDSTVARKVKTKLGVKLLDDMLQIVWYQAQLRRMGRGLEPRPTLGRWRALLGGFVRSYAFNPFALLIPRRPTRRITEESTA